MSINSAELVNWNDKGSQIKKFRSTRSIKNILFQFLFDLLYFRGIRAKNLSAQFFYTWNFGLKIVKSWRVVWDMDLLLGTCHGRCNPGWPTTCLRRLDRSQAKGHGKYYLESRTSFLDLFYFRVFRYSRSTNFIAVLSSVSLLMAAIVIGIIGYNFSYYKVR